MIIMFLMRSYTVRPDQGLDANNCSIGIILKTRSFYVYKTQENDFTNLVMQYFDIGVFWHDRLHCDP